MAAECIMVQGTMSGAGKSLLTAALCRIFLQDGLRVAPFKSQNMALNSYVTPDGLELGRAQAMQAEAAGLECDVRMNPILLKPSSEMGSQVIVNGEVRGQYSAKEYFRMKKSLIPDILSAYRSLAEENDVIVIEGAGSPAEINLREDDIVNMGLAELVDAPVLLTGDIDRGGVFAQLYGTVALLRPEERKRLAGLVINKFRGDLSLLQPGLRQIEELTQIPVVGVVPFLNVDLDEEDSLAPMLSAREKQGEIDIAVIRLPHISNFTDFAGQLGVPDLLILPGTKNTMGDLLWLRNAGLEQEILALAAQGIPVLGICGGFQMLGKELCDPAGVERQGSLPGLGLLPCRTIFTERKTRTRASGIGLCEPFAGAALEGYEIHMGTTESHASAPFCRFSDGREDGAVEGLVFGTYLHGLFDSPEALNRLAAWLGARKGITIRQAVIEPRSAYRQKQYDMLADAVRASLDMGRIYQAMEAYHH